MKRIVTILFTVSLLCSILAFASLAAETTQPEGAPGIEDIAKAMEAITGKNTIKDKAIELPEDSVLLDNGVAYTEQLANGTIEGMASWQKDSLTVLTKKAKDGKKACIILENVGKDTMKPLYFSLLDAEESMNIDNLGAYLEMPILNGCSCELKIGEENDVWYGITKLYNPEGKLEKVVYSDADFRNSAAIKAVACTTDEKGQPVCGVVWNLTGQDYEKTGTGHTDLTVIAFDPMKNTRFSYDTKEFKPDKASLKIATDVMDEDVLFSSIYLFSGITSYNNAGDAITLGKDCKLRKIADGSFAVSMNGGKITAIVVKTDNGYTVISEAVVKSNASPNGFVAGIENGELTPIYIFNGVAEDEALAKKQTSFYVKNISTLFNASATVSLTKDANGVITKISKAFDDNNKTVFSSEVRTYPHPTNKDLKVKTGQNYGADGKPTYTTYVIFNNGFKDSVFTNLKNGDSFILSYRMKNNIIDLNSISVKMP